MAESCPPYTIASVARDRVVDGASLTLPQGYDEEVLYNVMRTTGYYDRKVHVTGRQASELRQIGAQVLALDEASQIQPPLTNTEKLSIQHLLQIVPQE
jgi:hypothetical protein